MLSFQTALTFIPMSQVKRPFITADLGAVSFPFCPFVDMVHKSASWREELLMIAILCLFYCVLLSSSLSPSQRHCSFSLEIHYTGTSVLQEKSNVLGAVWLGLLVLSFHRCLRHWEHLSWEPTISLWGLSLGSLLDCLRPPQWCL